MVFESNILNLAEQADFLDLLRENDKSIVDHPWKLLFESRHDNLTRLTFINKVWDHSNVLILIQLKDDCIIGGFTKIGWQKSNMFTSDYEEDKDAFLFYFKSPDKHEPFICNIESRKIEKAIGYDSDDRTAIACFGSPFAFYIEDGLFVCQYCGTYGDYPHGSNYLAGDSSYSGTNPIVEVFEIQM